MNELVEKMARAMKDRVSPGYFDRADAPSKREAMRDAEAALSAIQGEYAVVPREPTEAMQEAIWLAAQLQNADTQYRAMIQAGEIK